MHAARARPRRRQIRLHRDVQLGVRAAVAHLVDVHACAAAFSGCGYSRTGRMFSTF